MEEEEIEDWRNNKIESINIEAPAGEKPIIKIKYFKEHGRNKHDAER